jgi:hypothetical protein
LNHNLNLREIELYDQTPWHDQENQKKETEKNEEEKTTKTEEI